MASRNRKKPRKELDSEDDGDQERDGWRPDEPAGSRWGTKNKWTEAEHQRLVKAVNYQKARNCSDTIHWPEVAAHMGTGRTSKQCRERWLNARPDAKKGCWTPEEEEHLCVTHHNMGAAWSKMMSGPLQDRSENAIKNHWNALMRCKTIDSRPETLLTTYIAFNRALANGIGNVHTSLENARKLRASRAAAQSAGQSLRSLTEAVYDMILAEEANGAAADAAFEGMDEGRVPAIEDEPQNLAVGAHALQEYADGAQAAQDGAPPMVSALPGLWPGPSPAQVQALHAVNSAAHAVQVGSIKEPAPAAALRWDDLGGRQDRTLERLRALEQKEALDKPVIMPPSRIITTQNDLARADGTPGKKPKAPTASSPQNGGSSSNSATAHGKAGGSNSGLALCGMASSGAIGDVGSGVGTGNQAAPGGFYMPPATLVGGTPGTQAATQAMFSGLTVDVNGGQPQPPFVTYGSGYLSSPNNQAAMGMPGSGMVRAGTNATPLSSPNNQAWSGLHAMHPAMLPGDHVVGGNLNSLPPPGAQSNGASMQQSMPTAYGAAGFHPPGNMQQAHDGNTSQAPSMVFYAGGAAAVQAPPSARAGSGDWSAHTHIPDPPQLYGRGSGGAASTDQDPPTYCPVPAGAPVPTQFLYSSGVGDYNQALPSSFAAAGGVHGGRQHGVPAVAGGSTPRGPPTVHSSAGHMEDPTTHMEVPRLGMRRSTSTSQAMPPASAHAAGVSVDGHRPSPKSLPPTAGAGQKVLTKRPSARSTGPKANPPPAQPNGGGDGPDQKLAQGASWQQPMHGQQPTMVYGSATGLMYGNGGGADGSNQPPAKLYNAGGDGAPVPVGMAHDGAGPNHAMPPAYVGGDGTLQDGAVVQGGSNDTAAASVQCHCGIDCLLGLVHHHDGSGSSYYFACGKYPQDPTRCDYMCPVAQAPTAGLQGAQADPPPPSPAPEQVDEAARGPPKKRRKAKPAGSPAAADAGAEDQDELNRDLKPDVMVQEAAVEGQKEATGGAEHGGVAQGGMVDGAAESAPATDWQQQQQLGANAAWPAGAAAGQVVWVQAPGEPGVWMQAVGQQPAWQQQEGAQQVIWQQDPSQQVMPEQQPAAQQPAWQQQQQPGWQQPAPVQHAATQPGGWQPQGSWQQPAVGQQAGWAQPQPQQGAWQQQWDGQRGAWVQAQPPAQGSNGMGYSQMPNQYSNPPHVQYWSGPQPMQPEQAYAQPMQSHMGMQPMQYQADMQPQPGMQPMQPQANMQPPAGMQPMQPQAGRQPMQPQPGMQPMQYQPGMQSMQPQPGMQPMQYQQPMQPQPGMQPMQTQPGMQPVQYQPMQPQTGMQPMRHQATMQPMKYQAGMQPMSYQAGAPAMQPMQPMQNGSNPAIVYISEVTPYTGNQY